MNETVMKIDANRLKQKRTQKGWTQQHLSEVSGLSLRTVQRAESTGQVSHETLKSLAATFGITQVDWLSTSNDRTRKGWEVALLVMALAHVLAILMVWMFTGGVNALLLKLMVLFWVVVAVIYATIYLTLWRQGFQSWNELKAARDANRR